MEDKEGQEKEGDGNKGKLESKPGQRNLDRLLHFAVGDVGPRQNTDADTDEYGRGNCHKRVQLLVVLKLLDTLVHVPVRFVVNMLHPHERNKMHK